MIELTIIMVVFGAISLAAALMALRHCRVIKRGAK